MQKKVLPCADLGQPSSVQRRPPPCALHSMFEPAADLVHGCPSAPLFLHELLRVKSPGARLEECGKARSSKSSLGDAKSSLGDAKSSLGDAKSSLGDAKSSLGDAKSSLGDAKSSLGDA
jgi:hypothetical protein